MVKRNINESVDNIHIEQINPRTELNDLEKTAIMQFKIEREEELSKTKQFKLLNQKKNKENQELLDLPKAKDSDLDLPKLKPTFTETIKIKLSDLREAIENDEEKNKKSLYDTVIFKLDDIINKNNSLKKNNLKKVVKIENAKRNKKKFYLFKPKDITKDKNLKLNIDSPEYGRQLYNLNKIALTNLSNQQKIKTRKYNSLTKLKKIDKVHVSKKNYEKYQEQLNKFAINKLYYKLAPKESAKYKLYRACVFLSSFIFLFTSIIIINWVAQGLSIEKINEDLIETTPISQSTEGSLYNVMEPEREQKEVKAEETKNVKVEESLYWKYLNTPLSSVDFTQLLKENNDTVGWLIVNNTNINYPVVQTIDNDYYLSHAFDRTSNKAGWVYADFRDDFKQLNKNIVIYGHGRKDKVMFGSLVETMKPEWYTNTDNQIIQLSTVNYNTMWQIFSIYTIEAESYYITTDFSDNKSYVKFLETMKNRSIYDFKVNLTSNDKILTLSTCYNDNGIRLVVQAKLVKIQER